MKRKKQLKNNKSVNSINAINTLDNSLFSKQKEQWLETLAEDYPKVKEELEKIIEEIVKLTKQFDPLSLLLNAYWVHLHSNINQIPVKKPQIYKINPIESLLLLEYIQSLLAGLPNENLSILPEIDEKNWAKLLEKIIHLQHFILTNYLTYKTAKLKVSGSLSSEQECDLFGKAYLQWCLNRGHRYMFHDLIHLKLLLEPHQDIIKTTFNIEADKLIFEIEKIKFSLTEGIFLAFKELKSIHENLANENAIEELENNPDKKLELESILNRAFRYDCFDLEKVTNLPKKLLKELSWDLGQDSEFGQKGEYMYSPLRRMPTQKKPFISINDAYYCFNYSNFIDSFYRVIERYILSSNPDYKEEWKAKQTITSESSPFSFFKKLLPGATILKNVYYQENQVLNKKANRIECDGLVIYQNYLFVIEIRGGKFTYTSPANDFNAYINSVNSLLLSPRKQATRLLESLKMNSKLTLFETQKDTKAITEIYFSDFEYTIPCVITLENIPIISSDIEKMQESIESTSSLPCWALSIDDLRIYTDIFSSPIYFLHYIKERIEASKSKQLHFIDELDHLGMYLNHNQYSKNLLDTIDNDKTELIIGDQSKKIDEFYSSLIICPELAKRPEQDIPEKLKEILDILDSQKKDHYISVSNYLLDMNYERRRELSEGINSILIKQVENKSYIKLSTIGDIKLTVSTRIIPLMPSKREEIRNLALAEVYGNKENKRLFLELDYDTNHNLTNVSWEFLTLADVTNSDEAKLKQLFEQECLKRIKALKKVGRNDMCPCGSNRKYKKCHGL